MRAYRELTRALALSVLRVPVTVFFTVVFAPMLVLILGAIFGNDPRPEFGGQGFIEMQLPALTAIVLAMMGVLTVPLDVVGLREQGVLRRLRATPLRPGEVIAADLTRHFFMGVAGLVLALLAGRLAFGLRPQGGVGVVLAILAVLVLGLFAFLALGYLVSAILPSTSAVAPVGNILIIVLLLTSGAMVPLDQMPQTLRDIAQYSPLTQLVTAVSGLWSGEGLADQWIPMVVLAGMTVVCGAVSVRLFRWE